MKVRATKLGYYDLLRRKEGTEFDLVPIKGKVLQGQVLVSKTFTPEEQFSKKWMEKVDATKGKPSRQPIEESNQEPV